MYTVDQAVFSKLFQDYQGLLHKAANQSYLTPLRDEAYAHAVLSFCEAVRTFDKSRGVPFPGYVKAKVYGDLYILFRQHRRNWQRENELTDDSKYPALYSDKFEENIVEKQWLKEATVKLSARQSKIIEYLFIYKYTQKEISQILNISQQAVAAAKKQALIILRKSLLNLL